MNTMSNIDSTPSPHKSAPAAVRYGTDSVDFGSKYISNIKDAYRNDEPWAAAIVDADHSPIARAKYLNQRGLGKNNLYSVLHAGLRIGTKFTSPDTTVRDALTQWARNLNHDFSAVKSYTPDQLGQMVANLDSVTTVLNAELAELARSAEIGGDDVQTWRRIIEGLESLSDAATRLHESICAGPGISVVHLDVDPKKY